MLLNKPGKDFSIHEIYISDKQLIKACLSMKSGFDLPESLDHMSNLVDSMWALYVGRPGGMAPAQVPHPEPLHKPRREKTWSAYGNNTSTGRASSMTDKKLPFDIEACTAANVTLCEFMRQINSTL